MERGEEPMDGLGVTSGCQQWRVYRVKYACSLPAALGCCEPKEAMVGTDGEELMLQELKPKAGWGLSGTPEA